MKIRSDILKTYQAVHTWVGICAGLLLFIGFYAGALSMWEDAIDQWATPPENRLSLISIPLLNDLVPQILKQYPEAKEGFNIYLTEKANAIAPITWGPTENWRATLGEHGELKVVNQSRSELANLIDLLHQTGGIPGELGREHIGVIIMGIASILYFLALVSGVILLLPTLVKDFFAVRNGKNRKRFWLDAHNVVGITSLPFHLLISWTVIVFAFHDIFYALMGQFVYGDIALFEGPSTTIKERSITDFAPISNIVTNIKAEGDEYQLSKLEYINLQSPRAIVLAHVHQQRHMESGAISGYLTLDPYSGQTLSTMRLPGKESTWGGIITKFFSLHFGNFGGILVRWLYFFMGLAGAFIFYSGNLLWLEKRRKRLRKGRPEAPQRRDCQLMANLTVGVCLGSIAALCTTMAAYKWAHTALENINAFYYWCYYTVFLLSLAWSFIAGAGRASVHLLYVAACTSAIIASGSLIAFASEHKWGWINSNAEALGVDITALVFAALFAIIACYTHRRLVTGNGDSVWAIKTTNKIT